ncbi:ATP-dependent DNA helicase PIF1 [Folsomia candida]|uniref:ATP-dependent DNA helicase n=1 Tax=Folsomia candida TaxID=158441 RepID=A0A226E3Q0_FOLCA|nr:ATP-dependent DNA helicase PIF1 [Folsomia candida]
MPSRQRKLRKYKHDIANKCKIQKDTKTIQEESIDVEKMEIDPTEVELALSPHQQLFIRNINQVANRTCFICNRLWYDKGIRVLSVTEGIRRVLGSVANRYDSNTLEHLVPTTGDQIDCCHRCHDNLNKGKVPATAMVNHMYVPESPNVISILTDVEARMVSRAKAFLKTHKLSRGRGQVALQGQVIHFAQSVEEVQEQLRLGPNTSNGTIIVTESVGDFPHSSIFDIRPQVLREALEWLLINNPGYSNVTMEEFNLDGIRLEDAVVAQNEGDSYPTPDVTDRKGRPRIEGGYVPIPRKPWMMAMRLSFCQTSKRFLKAGTGGKQCTAMSAAAVAYAAVKSPGTWTIQDGDRMLTAGDYYYQKCRNRIIERNATNGEGRAQIVAYDYLNPDEIEGQIANVFGKSVSISLVDGGIVFYAAFERWMAEVEDYAKRALASAIEDFVSSNSDYALITGGQYTMGLSKSDGHLYYFDSHARTQQGMISNAATQQALILKLRQCQESYHHLCKIVNNNCVQSLNAAVLTVTPLNITIREDINSPSEVEEIDNPNDMHAAFGDEAQEDCLIHNIDFLEPRLDRFGQSREEQLQEDVTDLVCTSSCNLQENVNLHRTAAPPINVRYEIHLEEKCFIQCFPHGQYGLDENRDQDHAAKLTPHAYFATRVMSADRRYLFYALSRSEQSIMDSKIAVCANMKFQDQENENAPVAENIHLYMSAIRGSKSYWKKYTGDIMAMVTRLGPPTFFLTVSTDDIGSADILTAMWRASRDEPVPANIQNLPYDERRELLNSNPVAAARHFNLRTQELIKLLTNDPTIFGKPVVDYTFRVEFQDRGSPHLHSLIWVENPPDFATTEGIEFIDANVSCSLHGETEIGDLVRRYQTHKNTPTCFKKGSTCRFGFPRPVMAETSLTLDEDSRTRGRGIILRRNEDEMWINNYHPKLLWLLRCNMDIQPVLGVAAVALYIAKYIGKNEPETFREDIRRTIQTLREGNHPIRYQMEKVSRILLNRRTLSSQECAARMCNIPMRFSSRSFVFVPTFRPWDRIRMLRKDAFLNGDEVKFASNIIDKYCERPDDLGNICLFEFASKYQPCRSYVQPDEDLVEGFEEEILRRQRGSRAFYLRDRSMGMWKKRETFSIVKSPSFHSDTDAANFIYAHILLYIPFRNEEVELLIPGESVQETYERRKSDMRTNEDFHLIRPEMATALEAAIDKISHDRDAQLQNDLAEDDHFLYFPDVDNASNVLMAPGDEYQIPFMDEESFETELAKMNPDQKEIYDLIQQCLDDQGRVQLKLFITGAGGTGKSFLISLLTNLIRIKEGGPGLDGVVLAAPTGVAALNINGQTLHRTFHLAVEAGSVPHYAKLGAQMLQRMREKFRNVEWIILDEVSMISYEVFRQIDHRLCDCFDSEMPFGGKNVICVGDLFQLEPVNGHCIYETPRLYLGEANIWHAFEFRELTVNMRQVNDPLLRICNHLREANLTSEDLEILRTRELKDANPLEPKMKDMQEKFKNSIRIYATRAQVASYNRLRTRQLRDDKSINVYTIRARDTFNSGPNVGCQAPLSRSSRDSNKCGGFPASIQLAAGSRIMVIRNSTTTRYLVNGSMGTVVGFTWNMLAREQHRSGDLPATVQVKFDDPRICGNSDGIFDLRPEDVVYNNGRGGEEIRRRMLPIVLCWAVTVHKVQGITVDTAVIYLGPELFAHGQAYVALSRVRTLDGVAILQQDDTKLCQELNQKLVAEMRRLRDKLL